jgi:transcriptional regulator with XRE-family HTH domain
MPKSPDPTDKHVGTRVRMRRLMLDMSQTKLADALGLSFQQVQKYENGVNRISASRLQQISEFLQAPIPFFFDGLPGPSNKPAKSGGVVPPSDVFQFMATTDGLSLAESFTRIRSPQLRRCIVSLVESLPSKASR